eukprot:521010-Pleurochrysis_carterae.AAC.1
MQAHLLFEWQCLTFREQRKHLPTQLREGWSRKTHPGFGSGRGSLDIHDVYFQFLQRAYFIRAYIGLTRSPYSTPAADGARSENTLGAVIWWLGSEPVSSSHYYMGMLVREAVGIGTRHNWFVPGKG